MRNGDPKRTVALKEVDHGALELTEVTGEKRTFYRADSVWLTLENLELRTSLAAPKEEGGEPRLLNYLEGLAKLDQPIAIIGDPSSKTRTLNISFHYRDDWTPPKPVHDDSILALSPPLGHALLGFNRRDWEIGNEDTWWASCTFPQSFIEQLTAAVRSGHLREMTVVLTLKNLYSDTHDLVPPSMKGRLFLRPNATDNSIGDPQIAAGGVSSLHFTSDRNEFPETPDPKVHEEPVAVEAVEPVAEQPPDQVAVALALLAGRIDLLRTSVKWVGGLIFLGLLLIAIR